VTVPAADILRCPLTREPLVERDGRLESSTERYPILAGIPILLNGQQSLFSAEQVSRPAPVDISPARRLVRVLLPTRTPEGGTALRYRRFVEAVRARGGGRRVLVIGGGQLGQGTEALTDAPDLELVETDVYIGPRTMIVCDGHHLPFADGSFDGVVIQAVLEHVLDPPAVVAEIHRVLAPGGLVYAETPFLQQVHEGAYDFTRWTESGHRRLFRMFEAIDTGVTTGPAIALLWSLCYFARSLARQRTAQLILEKLTIVLFLWLKPLDAALIKRASATDGACGVYFMGRRADSAVDDHDVISWYRGTIGVPVRRQRTDA
jgi:SAM-dependent methyltransferase